jgi:hypothetical protein
LDQRLGPRWIDDGYDEIPSAGGGMLFEGRYREESVLVARKILTGSVMPLSSNAPIPVS